jgi:biopolymer transport protein ExbD
MRKRRSGRGSADIDITPLIDVLFILIIFFVLTASFVQGSLNVELPSAKAPPLKAERTVTVTVERDGRVLWNGSNVTKEELKSLADGIKGRNVLIAGDKEAPYGTVTEVLAILNSRGVKSAGLLTGGGEEI